MGLQVWLPLSGNTKQQGLSNIAMTGSPSSWVNGKIGQCAHFTGNVDNAIYNNTTDFNYTDNFSWAVWIKTNFTGTTAQYVFTNGRADTGGYGYGIQCVSSANCYVRFGNQSYTIPVTGGEWTHLAFTKKGTLITIYKNGSVHTSQTFNGTLPTYSDGNGLGLGCFHYSYNIYPFYGDINDFRIYDHVLSPREVKEISKGLVLHYPLSMPGQENLLKNSHSKYDNNGYYVGTYTFVDSSKLETGKTYTLSFNGELQDDIQTGWYFNIFPSPYTQIIKEPTDKEGRFAFSFVMPENDGNRTSIGCYSLPIGNRLGCAIWDVKLEEGSTATPWTPAPSDALYSQMGLDNNIEYDVSGYQHNGTKYGTLTYSSDTPRYSTSAVFNGTDNCIQFPFNDFCTNGDAFTMNIWWKKTELGTKNYETLIGCPSGFEMDTRAGSAQALSLYMASRGTLYSPFNMNEWYMITLVNDGTNELYYVNGVLVKTIEKKDMPNGNYYIGAWRTGVSQNFQGNISDFRFYKTALSAEDILELYHTPITLANNGVLMTQGEFEES